MKTLTTIIFLLFATCAFSQVKTKQDANGNFIQVSASKDPAKSTGKTFTDSRGVKYDVMQSAKGRLFVVRTSKKSGKQYKTYLN